MQNMVVNSMGIIKKMVNDHYAETIKLREHIRILSEALNHIAFDRDSKCSCHLIANSALKEVGDAKSLRE